MLIETRFKVIEVGNVSAAAEPRTRPIRVGRRNALRKFRGKLIQLHLLLLLRINVERLELLRRLVHYGVALADAPIILF